MKYLCLFATLTLLSCGAYFSSGKQGDGGGNGSGDGGGGGGNGDGGGGGGGNPNCVNLECKQVTCLSGGTTTVSGTVYAPNGTLPLYNAVVYVPNAPLSDFTPGVSCDVCGAAQSGAPLVQTLTGPDGKFVLQNVPAGANIPLVIQIGRWRRQYTLPVVQSCLDNPLVDPAATRMPRNKSEGDIPQMAIATGNADPFECLLTKLGIDTAEITLPTGNGRVHFFHQNGIQMAPAAPAASTLWTDLNVLKKYDVVMLPCEGGPNLKPGPATQNLIDYTSAGGRVFTTHYSYVWIANAQAPFPSTGMWNLDQPNDNALLMTGTVDTSFPKGMAFSSWLSNVGAASAPGQVSISEWRHDLDATTPKSTRWIYGRTPNAGAGAPNSVQHMTFNTPVDAPLDPMGNPMQCGRVVYSDFHVSANALQPGQTTFPASCKTGDLSAQEKALVFMLFDLSACVQDDSQVPIP